MEHIFFPSQMCWRQTSTSIRPNGASASPPTVTAGRQQKRGINNRRVTHYILLSTHVHIRRPVISRRWKTAAVAFMRWSLLSPDCLYSQPHYRYHNDTDRGTSGSQAICPATEAGPHTDAIVKSRHNAGAVLSAWYLCVGDWSHSRPANRMFIRHWWRQLFNLDFVRETLSMSAHQCRSFIWNIWNYVSFSREIPLNLT